MAKAAKAQIVGKTPGTKIAVRQSGNKIFFGDDDVQVRCDNRQRDYEITVDVFTDREANLQTGAVEGGGYYVAEVIIPPYEYPEIPDEGEETEGGAGIGGGHSHDPLPIDMGKVVVYLLGLDNIPATIRNQLTTQDSDEQED